MEILELDLGDSLLRAENGVLEVFQVSREGSIRLPLRWLTVKVDPPKRGQVLLRIGIASPPGQVLYGPGARLPGGYTGIYLPAGDEPRARDFFSQLASLCDRSVQA